MTKIISFFLSVCTLISLILPGIKYTFKPTVEVDCAYELGEITTRATGYLYGLAEEGVPSPEMAESIDISSVSQKTIDGSQHPIGDIDHVAKNLDSCDYIVVYLQDCFDTWYYCHDEIMQMREAGNYDPQKFMEERFFPQVREQIEKLKTKDYSNRLVYCLYNECDNAIWFGNPDENGWLQFDEIGRQNYYSAWKQTYELVKSIDPDAKIGGPGYYEYNAEKLDSFLSFCKENDCVPEIMIYHELSDISAVYWEEHVEEYRKIEKDIGIDELPIIVTEYGTMQECGNPGATLQYICAIEKSGTWADTAYWRLANNLCDTAADDNSPNANWWLYRWYADMEGQRLQTNIIDITHADVANVVKYNRDRFHIIPLNGIASINDPKDEVTVLLGGCDYEAQVALQNLAKTQLGNGYAHVKVERVTYKGLSGIVSTPELVSEYTVYAANSLKVKVKCTDSSSVYKVTVSKADGKSDARYTNSNIPVRYEFENGTLLGDAYTYDSAYATTGQIAGMVGGMEKDGDGVSIKIHAPQDGLYRFDIIYGKHNDAGTPEGRISAKVRYGLDEKEEIISLPNTVRSEFTNCITLIAELTEGEHTVTFKNLAGTYVLDSMLVSLYEEAKEIAVLPDSDRSSDTVSAFLAVAPADKFYTLKITPNATFLLDGAECKADANGIATVYLRRGLNYIEVQDKACGTCVIETDAKKVKPYPVRVEDIELADGAFLNTVNDTVYVDGISSEGGLASFAVTVPKSGNYRMTVTYSNNREGGVHAYNVDLIECYVTVSVNGNEGKNLWCRNTESTENFKTVTMNLTLNEGKNVITLSNNGATLFNNMTAYAPNISGINIVPACAE